MNKKHEFYDVVVIGGGPAGLTAGIYTGRSKLSTLILEKSLVGGLATYTDEILNYPGFPNGITGMELMKAFQQQAKSLGVKFKLTDAKTVHLEGRDKIIETFRTIYHAKAIIIATGNKPKVTGKLNEEKFLFDKGISFCATCDAPSCEGKVVAVVGGGDSAFQEAIYLARFAKTVYMIVRREQESVSATRAIHEAALQIDNLHILYATELESFHGDEYIESIRVSNSIKNTVFSLAIDRVFLFIGYTPDTEIFNNLVDMTDRGYIKTDHHMSTNITGVFAAGDVCDKQVRQVATAVGDGAAAGVEVERYIAALNN